MSGKQTFNVPNDSEGREFLRLLKKFKAPGHSFRARSRGTRKLPGVPYVSFNRRMSIPQDEAESFAVYMGKKENGRFVHDEQLTSPEMSLVWRRRRGELQDPLNWEERNAVMEAIHAFIDDNNFVFAEEDYDRFEEIHSKLGLDK